MARTPSRLVGGQSVDAAQGLTEAQYAALRREFSAEWNRRTTEAARQAEIRDLQESLRTRFDRIGRSASVRWNDPKRLLLSTEEPPPTARAV
jgi:hypothetical protein